MKIKKKSRPPVKHKTTHLPTGMQTTHEVAQANIPVELPSNVFTPMETGQPDEDPVADFDNPQAVQGNLGPLNQDGEGELQNDQLAALEQIEPDK